MADKSDELSNSELESIAEAVASELDSGQYGNNVVMSRRQALGVATGALSLGALGVKGTDTASAQTGPAGRQGTPEEPNDMYAWDLDVENKIIDAAGVVHTGELADIDDVGGGGGGLSGVTSASDFAGTTGGDQIQNAINDADASAGDNVVFVGPNGPDTNDRWDLADTITIPSNTTLILWSSHLRLQNGVNDNIVRNENARSGDATRDASISIIGDGNAILDGNASNQDRSAVSGTYPTEMVGLNFFKVDSLSIKNVRVGPTNGWGILPEDVTEGKYHNIQFEQDGSTPNQDGIHIMGPGENHNATGLTGSLEDDVFAVESAGSGFAQGAGGDLYNVSAVNITVEDVENCALLRTIAGNGHTLDGVFVHNATRIENGGGDHALKIGWGDVTTQPSEAEHTNIVASNIRAKVTEASRFFLRLESDVSNLTVRSPRGDPGDGIDTGGNSYSDVNLVDWSPLGNVTLPTGMKWDGTYIQSTTPTDASENDEWINTS